MDYRVENKYLVSDLDLAIIEHRLQKILKRDGYQKNNCYEIRSMYFDDIYNNGMNDNDAGIDCRKKYRIRIYFPETSLIKLEIKEKRRGYTRKQGCTISRKDFDALCYNKYDLSFGDNTYINEFIFQKKQMALKPKTIIVYERSAYVYPSGNVRITFDRNISASKDLNSFFEKRAKNLVPVLPKGMHILEVKYDEILPDIIAKQLEIGKLKKTAFSKYYLGRMATEGIFF